MKRGDDEKAEEIIKAKYASLMDRYMFVPLRLETFASWGDEAWKKLRYWTEANTTSRREKGNELSVSKD